MARVVDQGQRDDQADREDHEACDRERDDHAPPTGQAGALEGAVALVLVPEGAERLSDQLRRRCLVCAY